MMHKINGQVIANSPVYQAMLIFGVALIIAVLELLANLAGFMDSKPNSPWIVMTSFILFFAIANSILSLRTPNLNKYWLISMITFVVYVACSGLVASQISGLSFDEAGSFRWIFMVLGFGYLVFLSVVRLIRQIVEYAIEQDNQLNQED
ncbi:MAG: hypothetical protein DRI69_08090 [Bacteroidetes bacterium]|nr:MAG: hypothetical protein DRI69_08090 [Bacteroidota bacterium]